QCNLVAVREFLANLGNRPVPSETTVAEPAKDIPADDRARQCDRRFRLRTDCAMMAWAIGVHAMDQTVHQQARPVKSKNPTLPVIADVHLTPAIAAGAVQNVQYPIIELEPCRPTMMSHGRF